MTDVNFVEYGENLTRDSYSVEAFTSFLATNGYAIGVVVGLLLVLFFFGLILVFGVQVLKKAIP